MSVWIALTTTAVSVDTVAGVFVCSGTNQHCVRGCDPKHVAQLSRCCKYKLQVSSHEDLCCKLMLACASLFCWSLLDFSYKLEVLGLENNFIAAGVRSAESGLNVLIVFVAVPGRDVPGRESCPAGWGLWQSPP